MTKKCANRPPDSAIDNLMAGLIRDYGYLIGGDELLTLLGYSSTQALNKAIRRHQVTVPVFELPYRRGKFALVTDVVMHLSEQRSTSPVLNQTVEK